MRRGRFASSLAGVRRNSLDVDGCAGFAELGLDGLGFFLARLAQMRMEIDQTGADEATRRVEGAVAVEVGTDVDDHTIGIRTGNQTGKNRILNEMNLIEGLRSLIRIPNLQIAIDIDADLDRTKEIAKPKKLLTNREKFEILSAKNPLINDLRDKLDLIPDQDD